MKIFLSSTIFDLRDLRDALVQGIETDGHEVIASEKGTLPVNPGKHSYEQCLKAAAECDCLIAILDGRFGGEYPLGSNKSITEAEIEEALKQGKKTLVFVRQSVWDSLANQKAYVKDGADYKPIKNIVEDTRVFGIIDRIRRKPQDNWIFQFNYPTDLLAQIRAQIGTSGTVINWLDRSRQLLQAQKHLTTNRLLNKSNRNLDDIHVPLGLIERKERPKVKEEPSPEQGSQLYQTEYTETKRFEHEAFLAEVVGKPAGGKHIAIIGEPGAGKTTILTKIGAWLIQQAEQQTPAPLVVAWISLADVGDRRLQEYIRAEWLQKVCEDNFDAAWEDWKGLRQQGRVWLLLDGLDEMSGDALAAIHRDLGLAWAQNLRVVMTCRLNQWETAAGGNILTNSFEVYRTLDYSYQTSHGDDQVKEFISKWFTDNQKVATQIRTELDAPGKERIKDLVKNPLRLTLLCASWEQDNQALPETQAELYQGFVNYLYSWKAREFQEEVKLKDELNLALGELAKAGLNRASINDGAVRRFRFTASEISKLWQDLPDTLLPAAKNLGWLNVVGEEAKEDLYAFYHPTFQEYFAACSIDDWDYFLPRGHIDRPVPCQAESVPTYRVFKKEWQQVIVFWIGRDFNNERKEEFLVKLTNFRDDTSEFYYYQAYCIAAVCVGEFQSSRHAEFIVQTVVKWAFGVFDSVQQAWVNLELVNSILVSNILPMTQREHLITSLLPLLLQNNLSDDEKLRMDSTFTRLHAISVLGKTAKGNIEVIKELTSFISRTDNDLTRITIAEVLGHVDPKNNIAINILIELLCKPNLNNYNLRLFIAQCLSRITIGNQSVIKKMLVILSHLVDGDAQEQYYFLVIGVLKAIAIGDRETIKLLLSIFRSSSNNFVILNAAKTLEIIAVDDQLAIEQLYSILSDAGLSDYRRFVTIQILGRIDIGNEEVVSALLSLFTKSSLDDFNVAEELAFFAIGKTPVIKELSSILDELAPDHPRRFIVAHTLGRIDVGNKLAITTLIAIMSQLDLDDYFLCKVIHSLREIAVGDRETMEVFLDFLSKPNLSDTLKHSVANALWHIDIGNNKSMKTLLDIFSQSQWDDSLPMGTGEGLSEIITTQMMPMVVNKLKHQITIDMCESNYKKFYICKTVIWKCAQALSYHEFYAAWYQV
jgi:HEAT repeat protein